MNNRRIQQHEQTRRQMILSGMSMAALPWLGRQSLAAVSLNPRFADNPFTLGVASGDPTSDGVVLWTRLAPEPLQGGGLPPENYPVRWELAEDEGFRKVVQSGTELAAAAMGHSVHVEVSGLRPDCWYWYRFHSGDAVSRTGRTRTMPAADVLPERLKFCFASCQHYETGLFTAYEHMAAENPDLVLHLGDYIYEYEGKDNRVRKHSGPEITTLEHYRNRYAQYRLDPQLQTMHALCPWLVVWDDHEFDNNCAGAISEERGVSESEYLLRRANAYQAYYENMPLRRPAIPSGSDMLLYRTLDFGRLARFEMLDTRQYRSDQPNGDGLKPLTGAVLDPQTTMLGTQQEQWLLSELSSSKSTWNVLGQQVMMARVDRVPGTDQKFSMDQWSGYEVARRRLLTALSERRISNPIVLTGDIHSNWVNDLLVDFDRPRDPVVATEFVCTSISSGGNGVQKATGHALLMSENPFVKFQNSERGYVSCEVTAKEWRSRYQVVEYVDRPGAPLVTRSTWAVEAGRAGAEQV
ncbi:MAG: alkaline phosphatase D family protein [Planctomyces sp.]|jgi:alkaline phosphatase D